MQEDKEAVFDSIDTIKMCLPVFTNMIKTMKINKDRMLQSAKGGFTNATDVADYLVKNNISFREAHEIVGKIVLYCIKNKKTLDELSIDEYKAVSNAFKDDVYDYISLEKCVEDRNLPGGTAKPAVLDAISEGEKFLEHASI